MKYAFCIPIYNTISGRLLPQFLNLQDWSKQLDGEIFTVVGRTHVDGRNWLCTDGGGFKNPNKLLDKCDYIVWIDADQQFNYQQLNKLLQCEEDFCAGWYIKDLSGIAMIADWDEEKFKDNGVMNFYHMDRIKTKKEPFEVDYCGFGFTKISTELIKQLEYPYFRQKVVNIGKYTENVSEDASFCLDIAQKTGVKPKIIPSLKINHLKEIFI
tara:strand:+ start:239 stop:874 length:636 start_codon:yes stop_codon:yes gene_type:complete